MSLIHSLQQNIFDENKLKFINSTLLLRGVSKQYNKTNNRSKSKEWKKLNK